MPKTLILGIGNTLLSDEGAGIRVVQILADEHVDHPEIECLDGGTLSFTLAGPVGDAEHLIVVDTAELSAEPGTVRVFCDGAMDAFIGRGGRRSVHEVGLEDVLTIARLEGRLPARRALIGIQPHTLDWGDDLTPPVAAAVAAACDEVRSLLGQWRT
ncbi:MAG: HyaD/HybD family hydrogenase maturation endopeptidase [Thiotrichales bacterium]